MEFCFCSLKETVLNVSATPHHSFPFAHFLWLIALPATTHFFRTIFYGGSVFSHFFCGGFGNATRDFCLCGQDSVRFQTEGKTLLQWRFTQCEIRMPTFDIGNT